MDVLYLLCNQVMSPMNTVDRFKNVLKDLTFFREKGIDPVVSRLGNVDVAYPASESEYCLLGGYAIVMVVAISDKRSELPIEAVYFRIADKETISFTKLGVRVGGGDLLAEIVTEKKDPAGRVCFENVSFWVIPVACFKFANALIAIDFKGERKRFTIMRGPWNLDIRIQEWISKHVAENKIQVAEHVPFEVLVKFIDREFFHNNRIQL